MEETLWRERRIRAFPRHEAMDRKKLKAEKIANVLRGGSPSAWLSLPVKLPSPVIFAIVLDCTEN